MLRQSILLIGKRKTIDIISAEHRRKFPEDTIVIKHEGLATDSLSELLRFNEFWNLRIDRASLVLALKSLARGKC